MLSAIRRLFGLLACGIALLGASGALAQPTAEALIKQVSTDVIDSIKADKAIQAGDINKIKQLVDTKVMPHVNFQRMTAAAVGRHWRQATPEQQKRLQEEFKTLIIRTYAGALSQVKDQKVELKPARGGGGNETVVRTEVRGRGEPIQLDYRLENTPDGWKVYDINVLGVWMVEQYRGMFQQEIGAGGIDGLIAKLAERNKSAAKS
jgi:phospholipid transport system substrate-binding protein